MVYQFNVQLDKLLSVRANEWICECKPYPVYIFICDNFECNIENLFPSLSYRPRIHKSEADPPNTSIGT